jgi:hypothetical protein
MLTSRDADPAIIRVPTNPDPTRLDSALDPAGDLTSGDEPRGQPAAPGRRATNELGQRPLPFESPAAGTDELLGRDEQPSQSIAPAGRIG